MIKKKIFFIILVIISILYYLKIDIKIKNQFNSFFTTMSLHYIDFKNYINNNIDKFFYQIKTIEKLKKQNKEFKLQILQLKKEIKTSHKIEKKKNFIITKAIKYVNFNDFTKIYIDYQKKDNKINGLIYKDYVAGIVKKIGDKTIAFLNGNDKCSYAVYIGDEKIPAIIVNKENSNHLLAKYIPSWQNIYLDDIVITSGMDNIFYPGIKVGKVIKIYKYPTVQEVEIQPFINVTNKKYFYLYKKE